MNPKPTDLVLIAYIPRPRDLELARQEQWYRVPKAHAPRLLAHARALAFYQGSRFGPRRWRVEWWAPVLGTREVRRRELLPDEADHPRADEVYVQVLLGPLTPLPRPLTSNRGRRLLFKPTTWGRLVRATTLDDLFDRRPLRDDPLYRLLQSAWGEALFALSGPEAPRQLRLPVIGDQ